MTVQIVSELFSEEFSTGQCQYSLKNQETPVIPKQSVDPSVGTTDLAMSRHSGEVSDQPVPILVSLKMDFCSCIR